MSCVKHMNYRDYRYRKGKLNHNYCTERHNILVPLLMTSAKKYGETRNWYFNSLGNEIIQMEFEDCERFINTINKIQKYLLKKAPTWMLFSLIYRNYTLNIY